MANKRKAYSRSGIYEIVNSVNGKRYIGSAVNLSLRFCKHRRELAKGIHHNQHLQRAFNLQGPDGWIFRPLIICSRAELLFYEQRCLDALRPEYNVCVVVGSRLGIPNSPEHNAKIGNANRGRVMGPLSAERRKKVGDANRGKPHGPMSDETKAKLSAGRKGKGCGARSQEWRENIAKALAGRKLSASHCERLRQVKTGTKLSDETKRKIGVAHAGKKRRPYKKHSPESNEKKKYEMLARWKDPAQRDAMRESLRKAVISARATTSGAAWRDKRKKQLAETQEVRQRVIALSNNLGMLQPLPNHRSGIATWRSLECGLFAEGLL